MKELLTVIPTEFGRKIKKIYKIKKKKLFWIFTDVLKYLLVKLLDSRKLLMQIPGDICVGILEDFMLKNPRNFLGFLYSSQLKKHFLIRIRIRNWTRIMSGTNVLFTVIQTEFAKNNFQKKCKNFKKNIFF